MIVTPRKHRSPSERTLAEGESDLAAKIATSSEVSGCWEKQASTGLPSGVVWTAAMKGTLFSEPRPVLPPERWPPR